VVRTPGDTKEQDLSWMDTSVLADVSPDGKTVLFGESGEGSGEHHAIYLRSTDAGSQPVRLGEGDPLAISPDGHWIVSAPANSRNRFVLVPTGAGESLTLSLDRIEAQGWPAWWSADAKRIYFNGAEPGRATGVYAIDIAGGPPRAVLPAGVVAEAISPDGKLIVASDPGGRFVLYRLENGPPEPVKGVLPGDQPLTFSENRFLYVQNGTLPAQVYRLELSTGQRRLWGTFMPPDATGVTSVFPVLPSTDGRSYAYGYERVFSDLYAVEGLK
jgi:eukaryotic-like serine/threonine-protein kinase